MSNTKLSAAQLEEVRVFHENKEYPEMYGALHRFMLAELEGEADPELREDLAIKANWLAAAKSINANDGSYVSNFVRGATIRAIDIQGEASKEQEFNRASNALAASVGASVLATSAVSSAAVIIEGDVSSAVVDLKLQPWNWAGTLGDVLPIPIGLGEDFVQVGSGGEGYYNNMRLVLEQNVAGVARHLLGVSEILCSGIT